VNFPLFVNADWRFGLLHWRDTINVRLILVVEKVGVQALFRENLKLLPALRAPLKPALDKLGEVLKQLLLDSR
jgi:hypothetical protein